MDKALKDRRQFHLTHSHSVGNIWLSAVAGFPGQFFSKTRSLRRTKMGLGDIMEGEYGRRQRHWATSRILWVRAGAGDEGDFTYSPGPRGQRGKTLAKVSQ